jgi:hypothetical protein
MTTIDEKEILEIEKLKLEIKEFDKKYYNEQKRLELEMRKTNYEAWKLSFYGVVVGAGATFAVAKTLQLLG